MILFFLTFFTLYGGVHAYAFFRTRSAFGFGPGAGISLALWMGAMVVMPFLIRAFERHEFEFAARTAAYIGYLWMAVLFLFFCGSLAFDLFNLAGRIAGWAMRRDFFPPLISPKLSWLISICLALVISVYGYFEAGNIRTERLRIETAKLPAGIERLTIVQISDVHLGLIVRCTRMEKILAIVRAEKPDIFISTGDLVDAQINHLPGLVELLSKIEARHGKFAITGNHEYYAGLDKALAFTRACGFTLLRGTAASSGVINIAGVDDPAGVQLKLEKPVSEKTLLSKLPRGKFTLLLKHQPRLDRGALGLFDLQLSGHTHKGQIWPFTWLSALTYPLNAGRFDLANGSVLYVSRGTGTWGPPIRFLSPPEVTVIELVRKKNEPAQEG
jgi:predicted MPP superfamily phosphohydrolase